MTALVFLAGIPAHADSVTILGGFVTPSGDSDIYNQNEVETDFEVDDLNDFSATFRYDHFIGNLASIGVSATFYESDTLVTDQELEFLNGKPIHRDISLQIVPLEFNLHFLPAGRDASFIPYFGGGIGFYFWEYQENGDFVIDRNSDPSVITGLAFSDGTDPGWHIEGGFQIPFSRSATFTAEAKYWSAEGDLDEQGFDPAFEPIDLSATTISAGVSIWF